jgi:hypothetical protein
MMTATTPSALPLVPHLDAAHGDEARSAPPAPLSSDDASLAKIEGNASISEPGMESKGSTRSPVGSGLPAATAAVGPTRSKPDAAV